MPDLTVDGVLHCKGITLHATSPSAYAKLRWVSDVPVVLPDGTTLPAGQELTALVAHAKHTDGQNHLHFKWYVPNKAGVGESCFGVPLFEDKPPKGQAGPGLRQFQFGGHILPTEGELVARSPNGKWWAINVSDAGVLGPPQEVPGIYVPANKS